MNVFIKTLIFSLILLLIYSCQEESRKPKEKQESSKQKSVFRLFEKVHPDSSNIHFSNNIGEISRTEYLSFQYIYNGGGVGIGDFNNDGLKDVFFTGNDVSNALYINQGGFQFKDISESAGILGGKAWGNGVCIVDINNDGYQDIYISNGGNKLGNDKKNALYINNKDLTFKESAEQFGIADTGWTSQSVFFDFDNDGDLDLYVMNHANEWLSKKDGPSKNDVAILSKDHLYRNDNNLFVDVSKSAGLIEEKFGGFGLGIAIGDINLDGYQDIYISSDYDSPDLLYINQGNSTFKEEAKQRFGHISYFSMGVDIADFNNDGLLDIFSLDMSAEDHTRIKTQMSGMAPERFNALIDFGLPHQYMYNALQKNNGDGTFADVAQFSNVESTDWSWSPLFADFDNDGLKDLFITNGSRYDLRDNDYRRRVKFSVNTSSKLPFEQKKQILDQAPSTPLSNYAYRNTGNLKFKKKSYEWGLSQNGFSQGAAYADLDNDGDLDLIINNVDEKSWVYQNKSEELQNSFIKINLEAEWSECIGAIIKVSSGDTFQIQNFQPCRGYMSTIDNTIHFGLGNQSHNIDIEVFWPDGTKSKATSSPNSTLSISKKDSPTNEKYEINTILKFQTLTNTGFNFTHKENKFDDFQAELLLPHKNSQYGPALACADINNDGLEDIFIGGSINQAGETYFQNSKGQFKKLENGCFKIDKIHEDIGATFFDFDNDGDMDLYIASGSNEFLEGPEYDHRLYINNGNGKFSKTTGVLPNVNTSGKSIAVGDFNGDGNPDLFVGGRQTPGKYPLPPESYLLIYESGKFVNKTTEICSELKNIGMVTASEWVDLDNDKDLDLIVVGEWMAIEIFINENGKLQSLNNEALKTNVG